MSSRRNRGGGGGHEGGEERWLLPYSDMITLLLGLFIVLFAMSSIDAKQFDNVRNSLSETFNGSVLEGTGGVLDGATGVMDPLATSQSPKQDVIAKQLQDASSASQAQFEQEEQELRKLVKQSKLGNDVKVSNNQRGIKLTLAGDALFDSGSSTLKPGVVDSLERIERELAAFGRPLEIAGHTDGAPYPAAGGNWRLSAERSFSVLEFFLATGYPAHLLEPTFRGDQEPVVKPPAGNPHKAIAANRRIEIMILAPGADDPRPKAQRIDQVAARTAARNGGAGGAPPAAAASGRSSVADQVHAEIQAQVSVGVVDELAATAKEQG